MVANRQRPNLIPLNTVRMLCANHNSECSRAKVLDGGDNGQFILIVYWSQVGATVSPRMEELKHLARAMWLMSSDP